ncbi:hypothetical protein DL93DRAFT_2074606 [Clavulina sp. PMI_390]|nr:hypothetical protein DL93DRAFT_2074606 [Clavulina sp. PMI_390]
MTIKARESIPGNLLLAASVLPFILSSAYPYGGNLCSHLVSRLAKGQRRWIGRKADHLRASFFDPKSP